MIESARVSEKLAMKPRAITPGSLEAPRYVETNSTKAPIPPELTTN